MSHAKYLFDVPPLEATWSIDHCSLRKGRGHMRRALICVALLALSAGICCAAHTAELPMNIWRVVDGDSRVRGDHLLLRNESAVEANVNMEIGTVSMAARTTERRGQGVLTKLTLTYDDGAEETCDLRVEADTRGHRVRFEPKFSDWRRVVHLKLWHPADRMELIVDELTVSAERPVMQFTDSSLLGSGYIPPKAIENGVLKVKWEAGESLAQIPAPRSRQVIVFGAKVDDSQWELEDEENLLLAAVDRDGRVLKRYAEPLNGRVQPVLFYLYDLDLSRVERLIFETDGNSEFAIRQIISGGMSGGMTGGVPGKQKWGDGELEQVNDRLEIVIDIIEQGGELSQQMVWQLKQLLLDYRRLE
jgi:hypothetical protein